MGHVPEIIKYAKSLGSSLVVDYDEVKFLYTVEIPDVLYKEKNSYLRLKIVGKGFTILDACVDFLRKCRGAILVHTYTDKEIEPL